MKQFQLKPNHLVHLRNSLLGITSLRIKQALILLGLFFALTPSAIAAPPPACIDPAFSTTVALGNSFTATWASTGAANYRIGWRIVGDTSWVEAMTTSTSYTINGLVPSTNYDVRFRAECGVNDNSNWVTGSFTTTAGCGVPVIAAYTPNGNSAMISWNNVGAMNYRIEWRAVGDPTWLANVLTGTSFNLINLLPSTDYEVRLRSQCANGDKSVWVNSAFTTTAGCGVPTLNTPVPAGIAAVISWDNVGASYYKVEWRLQGNLAWNSTTTSNISRQLINLTTNSNYDYRVRSVCANGDQSVWVNGTFTTVGPCAATTLNTPNPTALNCQVSWANMGATNYRLEWRKVGEPFYLATITTGTSYTIPSLTIGTQYEYRVRVRCTNGDNSDWTNGTFSTLCNLVPTLTAAQPNGISATVNWVNINAASYRVQHRAVGSPTWIPVVVTTNSRHIVGLTPNTNYEYQVRAECLPGLTDWASGTFTTTAGCPDVTLNAPVPAATTTQVSWNNVGATNYRVEWRAVGAPSWFANVITATTFNITLLSPSTNYEYRVRTTCVNGSPTNDIGNWVNGTFTTTALKNGESVINASIFNFNGEVHNASNELTWSTISEDQNNGFKLMNSTDGKNYQTLATIASKATNGTSEETLNYAYTHENPAQATNYYRIETIGTDGASSIYNRVVTLNNGVSTTASVYPNPTKGMITVELNSTSTNQTLVKVMDMTGRVVKQIQATTNAGTQSIQISLAEFSTGVYTVQVYSNDQLTHVTKVQKQN